MAVKKVKYRDVRKDMKPGDIIAFGGVSPISQIIKFATRSSVSHVGTVLHTQIPSDDSDRYFNQLIESTSGKGVHISRLSDVIDTCEGEVWWLPLNESIRESRFNQKEFFNFLFDKAERKTPYDLPQAVGSAIDALDSLPFNVGPGANKEDFSKLFCSELVAAGLEISGAIDPINASEITPIELCQWNIYQADYYQLRGENITPIKNYNSITPLESAA